MKLKDCTTNVAGGPILRGSAVVFAGDGTVVRTDRERARISDEEASRLIAEMRAADRAEREAFAERLTELSGIRWTYVE